MAKNRPKSFTYDTYLRYDEPTEVEITAANTPVPFVINTEAQSDRVVGIQMSLDSTDKSDDVRIASSLKLALPMLNNGIELFPINFRCKNFFTGLEVSPNDRFWNDVDAPAGTSRITGALVCTDLGVTYPFKVIIQLQETFLNDERDAE